MPALTGSRYCAETISRNVQVVIPHSFLHQHQHCCTSPSHQPRLLQAHLSSLRNMCNLACKRGKLQQKVSCIQYPSIHPSIHLLSDRSIRRGLSSCNYERVFILMSPELGAASCGHCYFGFILYLFEPLKIMGGKIFEFHYHSHSVKYESQI